ncbi:MAG: glycosyltransferase [Cyanobacteria bacterium J06642_9]
MRHLYFLVPGTSGQYRVGGLFAELKIFKLAQQICRADVVTYAQPEKDTLFLDDLLTRSPNPRPSITLKQDAIFVVSWGFHVPKLVKRLKGYNIIYHAHSAGYGFTLPSDIPILTVSRNSLGYWGQRSINSLLYYLPNHISKEFQNRHQPRDIDVPVQSRKSSGYLLNQLVPGLKSHCKVTVLDSFVEDLAGVFNRSKVYLYDSAEYWGQYGISEGFGLPPLEAMACGCQVFASVNGALADYLDPGFNCHKIAAYSTAFDVQRILKVVQSTHLEFLPESFFDDYREVNIVKRLRVILAEINDFFDHTRSQPGDISGLTRTRRLRLLLKRVAKKLKK